MPAIVALSSLPGFADLAPPPGGGGEDGFAPMLAALLAPAGPGNPLPTGGTPVPPSGTVPPMTDAPEAPLPADPTTPALAPTPALSTAPSLPDILALAAPDRHAITKTAPVQLRSTAIGGPPQPVRTVEMPDSPKLSADQASMSAQVKTVRPETTSFSLASVTVPRPDLATAHRSLSNPRWTASRPDDTVAPVHRNADGASAPAPQPDSDDPDLSSSEATIPARGDAAPPAPVPPATVAIAPTLESPVPRPVAAPDRKSVV